MSSESSVVLSSAELAFLLSANDGEAAGRAGSLLGVAEARPDDALVQSGVAGLLLRDLARVVEGALTVSPAVMAVADGLLRFEECATVSSVVAGEESSVQLFVGPTQSLAVRLLAFGCFQFDGLRDGCQLAEVVASLMAEPGSQVVVASINERGSIAVVKAAEPFSVVIDDQPSMEVAASDLSDCVRAAVTRWPAQP